VQTQREKERQPVGMINDVSLTGRQPRVRLISAQLRRRDDAVGESQEKIDRVERERERERESRFLDASCEDPLCPSCFHQDCLIA